MKEDGLILGPISGESLSSFINAQAKRKSMEEVLLVLLRVRAIVRPPGDSTEKLNKLSMSHHDSKDPSFRSRSERVIPAPEVEDLKQMLLVLIRLLLLFSPHDGRPLGMHLRECFRGFNFVLKDMVTQDEIIHNVESGGRLDPNVNRSNE